MMLLSLRGGARFARAFKFHFEDRRGCVKSTERSCSMQNTARERLKGGEVWGWVGRAV